MTQTVPKESIPNATALPRKEQRRKIPIPLLLMAVLAACGIGYTIWRLHFAWGSECPVRKRTD